MMGPVGGLPVATAGDAVTLDADRNIGENDDGGSDECDDRCAASCTMVTTPLGPSLSRPQLLPLGGHRVTRVAAGWDHSLFITSEMEMEVVKRGIQGTKGGVK